CFTTEILEGFDVQRTSGFADTVRRYGYLTKSIIQYYTMHFIDMAMFSKVCPSYDEFVKKCQDLEKMTVSDVFALQLMQVPQVTEEIALAVVDLYPTLLSLAQAYSHLEGDLRAQEELLKNKSKIISASASRNIFKLIWGDLARFICWPEPAMTPLLAGVVVQDDGSSSSVTSSPLETLSLSPPSLALRSPWVRELKSDERGLCLIQLLLDCANRVASGGSLDPANAALEHIALLAAPDGDAMQRIASHFAEALARRAIRSWPGLCHALDSARVLPLAEAAVARRHFLDLCPFLRLSFVVTNQAIMEAMEGERVVHVVDLNASDPTQWIPLLQALSARSEGPPHLKITGIHEHKDVLHYTAIRLSEAAERLDVPFQFIPVVSRLDNLDIERLRVKTGEALAISSVLQLHSLLATDDVDDHLRKARRIAPLSKLTPGEFLEKDHLANTHSTSAESASRPPTRIQSLLASLCGLSPKIVVVTEQEANHNGQTLKERLVEALFYYAAVFDGLDLTVPRQSVERLRVEKMLFGEEIRNIIACEGLERKERHEKLERWGQRMGMAGFRVLPLSYYGLLQARRLLQCFGWQGYKVKEENGCFLMCWQDRPLFSISAWRCNQKKFSTFKMALQH
ncbi:Scarecrow-like protein, partial [Musa troglodytarum]